MWQLTICSCATGQKVAASLVEAQAYAYLYGSTSEKQVHGDSALVDLSANNKDAFEVLGAVLLDGEETGACQQLVVLSNEELKVYDILQ